MIQELLSQLFFWLLSSALLGFILGFFLIRRKNEEDE